MNERKDLAPQLADLEARLGAATGKKYWRTLEELADTPAFQELIHNEFPDQATDWSRGVNRRQFLTLMGASLALAGLNGCSVKPAPSIEIVPYVNAPELITPGRPLFYATAMTMGGAAIGLLVESHMGRPTKIEGNPLHPASRGAATPFNQASILTLYDPDRSQTVTLLGKTSTWEAALGEPPVGKTPSIGGMLRKLTESSSHEKRGEGLRILTESICSPTLARQLDVLLKAFPRAKWHRYEPLPGDSARRAARLAYGEHLVTRYDFTKAKVVLSLDADFFVNGPASLRYAGDFMAGRRIRTTREDASKAEMNRLYAIETGVTCTGSKADHRLAVRPSEVESFARALAARLKVRGAPAAEAGLYERWLAAVAEDLDGHHGSSIVLAGDRQPPAVHLLAHAINEHLENVGKTVLHTDPVEHQPTDHAASLRELVKDVNEGRVQMLVILGGNPVFTAPVDVPLKEAMQKVPLRAHLSMYQDETSLQCHWHLPEAHYLEAWGDARAYDGTASVVQPLIEPLYHGRSALELLSCFTNRVPLPGRQLVRDTWRKHWEQKGRSGRFEDFWQEALHDGTIRGTDLKHRTNLKFDRDGWAGKLGPTPAATATWEIAFEPDPTIYDGRFANNAWLQELPKPMTRLTWGNAAFMSPATAKELGVRLGSYAHGGEHGGYHMPVVELTVGGRTVKAPAWIMPGHADKAITLSLGYGREYAGKVGGKSTGHDPLGSNAYLLRTADQPGFVAGLEVKKVVGTELVACVQEHHLMENREPVRSAALKEYHHKPMFALEREEQDERDQKRAVPPRTPLTMYRPFDYGPPKHKWGMVIDLTTCIGCMACVAACQAENNIPVVGKGQVAAGREMHWLRIDRYISGSYDAPKEFHFQPVPCMHCENAPCEYVCPVEATVHSSEGLNDMVYQRCVGTRFCSNNCPYKVRRFNFFFYADYDTPSLRQQYNPDVTVRSRGVMEKCSYCVQRIRQAEIDSQVQERPVTDGEVLTACQATCPVEAIVFGDINDDKSKVKKWKDSPLHYALLGDLNTEPRTTYLAALRNPNPRLEDQPQEEAK